MYGKTHVALAFARFFFPSNLLDFLAGEDGMLQCEFISYQRYDGGLIPEGSENLLLFSFPEIKGPAWMWCFQVLILFKPLCVDRKEHFLVSSLPTTPQNRAGSQGMKSAAKPQHGPKWIRCKPAPR